MDCARNIITAAFPAGKTETTTAPLWQWDYGQALCITGIDLPAAFEVHFSTNRTGGVSTVAVGVDGQVTIPNVLLTIGKNLNAWIYLSDAQGEGETEYSIFIPVKARPMPETYDAEVTGEFNDVVRQVSEYAETAQTAADNAGASASAAAASASEAAASASAAETAKTAAETAQGKAEDAQAAAETAAQTATQKAQQTAQDAAQAALDAGRAESAAGSAEAAQTGAESAKTDAETAAQGAAASASAASASSTSAGQAATSAAQSSTAAAGSATTAQGAAQTATTKAGEASAFATAANTAKTAAQTAQTAAETAAGTAAANATTASTKAAEAAQSASGAAQSKADAEAAATRAETAAASLTVDSALSDSSVNPVQNKVITGAITDVKTAIDALKITDTASGAIASFPDGAAMPMESLTVELEPIQEGTGDPSPDNIRPIAGRESVTVTRTGVNVWDEEWEVGIINSDGLPVDAVIHAIRSKNFCSIVGGETYYVTCGKTDGGLQNVYYIGAYFYDEDKTFINRIWTNNQTFTAPDNARYFKLSTNSSTVVYGNTYNHDITVNYPSTDHDYHSYNGQSVTVQLGQSVYGGTLDVTTGKLTVERKKVTLTGTEDNFMRFTWGHTYSFTDLKTGDASKLYAISNQYKPGNNYWGVAGTGEILTNQNNVTIMDDRFNTVEAWNAYVAKQYANGTPIEVCYVIATPLEITLDPVTLSTLKGQNNVWSDADSVTVDYVADPKLYIARLTEPDADMVADANITSGSYFMVGNNLYLATANIASGATIVSGVNCTKTNLSSALNAINA